MTTGKSIPSVSVTYARNGGFTRSNELGMRRSARLASRLNSP